MGMRLKRPVLLLEWFCGERERERGRERVKRERESENEDEFLIHEINHDKIRRIKAKARNFR